MRLQDENDRMEDEGLRQVEMAVQERKAFEEEELATIMTELEVEIEDNRQIKLEMETLMERVRYLNRVNNELVFKFSNL